jgi:hypothetical protein
MSLIDFFIFFVYGLVENLIIGKNQEKKVSVVSWFSGYSGFAGRSYSKKMLVH